MASATSQVLQDRIREIKRLRIWERAWRVVENLGRVTGHDGPSSFPGEMRTYRRVFDGLELEIKTRNTGQFGECRILEIRTNGSLVFNAEDIAISKDKWGDQAWRVISGKSKAILINTYLPGDWQQGLDIKKIEACKKRNAAKEERECRKAELARKRNQPGSIPPPHPGAFGIP